MSEAKRRRGRPKKVEAREMLMAAGRDLLLSHGLRVTVDAIVTKATVAKTTFYTYFADKESFIESVMRKESARTITDEEYLASQQGELRDVLVRFGVRYLSFANEHRLTAWDKIILSANDLYPELAVRLYQAGPGRVYTILTDILAHASRTGELKIDDPSRAAEELTGIWYGYTVLRVNLKVLPPMTEEEIRSRAERGVDVLYRLYA